MDTQEDSFDIDAGVANIAESMGFEPKDDAIIEDDLESKDGDPIEDDIEPKDGDPVEEDNIKPAPASWAKDQHENWTKIPDEAKQYIELREKQMLDGIEQYKQGYKWGEQLNKAFEPYRDLIDAQGIDEITAVSNLLSHERALTQGSTEARQNAFIQLGQKLGLIPVEGQQMPDAATQQLQQRLARIEQQEQQRERENYDRQYQATASEVETFAADPKHGYFDEVADDIIMLLQAGLDLQSAYDRAVWANPVTRAKEQERVFNEKAGKQKETAIAAKKATSANIKSTSRAKPAPQESKGTWDDTMRETLNKLKQSD